MKVYTHYHRINDKEGLRWGTLLQFGTSWDILGSVVMKNPGSSTLKANSVEISDSDILSKLREIDDRGDKWYEFTDDDTMRKAAVLFASYYGLDCANKLNGVIKIFNLFYVMDANEQQAEQKMGLEAEKFPSNKDLLDYDISHLVKPVYLGFGDLAFKEPFKERAERYFNTVFEKHYETSYLNKQFDKNTFYHPQYLCGSGQNNKQSIYIRGKFKEKPLSDAQLNEANVVELPRYSQSKEEQIQLIKALGEGYEAKGLKPFGEPNDKTIRFLLPKDLQITITATGKGYIAIRHTNYSGKCDKNKYFKDNEKLFNMLSKDFGFTHDYDVWIGCKPLNDFSDADSLFDLIKKIKSLLK